MDHMNLQEFIRTTLVQITAGVEQAISESGGQANGAINPRKAGTNFSDPTAVEFDVAVTVTETAEAGGKAKLTVAWLNVGAGLSSGSQSQAISRIRFAVPVALPSLPMEKQVERHSTKSRPAGTTQQTF